MKIKRKLLHPLSEKDPIDIIKVVNRVQETYVD